MCFCIASPAYVREHRQLTARVNKSSSFIQIDYWMYLSAILEGHSSNVTLNGYLIRKISSVEVSN